MSVLLVLTRHSGDPLWLPLRGQLGVSLFFLISGFIITTLLLREESARGRVSLRAFYLRRAYRIFPLYYVALALTCALVAAGLGTDRASFPHRLPYFLTYLNELAVPGTFGHTWSLGVEEKFYLVWPLLAFRLPGAARARWAWCGGLAVLGAAAGLLGVRYPAMYVPILLGCLLALAMHHPRGHRAVAPLARTRWLPVLLALAAAGAVLDHGGRDRLVFPLAVLPLLPGVVLGTGGYALLGHRVLTYLGRRSYALYLFHPVTQSGVDLVVPPGGSAGPAVIRLATVLATTLVLAEVMHRLVERPCIRRGRRAATRALRDSGRPPTTPPRGPAPIPAVGGEKCDA